jgi:hypothetical protein
VVFLGLSGQLPAQHLKLHHCLFVACSFYGAGLKIINLLVVCFSLLYFDSWLVPLMDKKSVLPSTTHFVLMKDKGNIFFVSLFCGFFLSSFCTEVHGDTEQENPNKTNLW